MTTERQPDERASEASIRCLRDSLSRLRVRARSLLLTRRLAWGLATILGVALAFALIDYVLRFPSAVRTIALLAGLVALVVWFRRAIIPAARFAPSLQDTALRVERLMPEYAGVLASAIDFTKKEQHAETATERALRERAIDNAGAIADRVGVIRAGELLRSRPAFKSGVLSLVALAVITLLGLLTPSHFAIGAQRVFLPLGDASWPKRTDIADATPDEFHALGESLRFRASLMKTPVNPEDTTVAVRYRLIEDGQVTGERRELMTWQERRAESLRGAEAETGAMEGELFERLIEPDAEALEYRFETSDDATKWRRIALIEPPRVLGATASLTPPEYAQGLAGEHAPVRGADMGPGTDERAIASPALSGSRVEMTVRLNKEVTIPDATLDALGDAATIRAEGEAWSFAFTLNESLRIPLTLVDSYGIESVEDAVYRFEALVDAEPTATITEPTSDESVLPTAVVAIAGEGRDDVGLSWVELERTVYTPEQSGESRPSGPGGAMEQRGEPETIARTETDAELATTARAEIDLSILGVSPGDEVRVQAVALDIYGASPETARAPTRSTVRVLRVLSQSEFIEDIQSTLSDIRQSAIRIDEQQAETKQLARERGAARPTTRSQGQVTERLARQQESIERLRERIERNALNDEALQELLAQAAQSLARAGESSVEASQRLDEASERAREEQREAGEPDPEAERLTEEESRDVERSQEQVRAELAQLIERLDRGQDNWVVRNTLENALGEQQSLQEQTESLGAQTAGRSADELDEEEKSELEKIVEKQLELAEKIRELTESLRDREQELREDDPGAAEALKRAAETADAQQLLESMQEAARQASENQSSNASQNQQQAAEALQQMLEDLESGQRAREEALERALQSIVESIEGLIGDQRAALEDLADATRRNEPLAGLAPEMIRLNQNTLGVRDLAFEAGSQLAPIFNLLDDASDAQVRAIRELREAEASAERAREHETQSLDLLTQALERAKEQQEAIEQSQDRRKREALKKAYFEALEAQAALREEALPFAQAEDLSRRDRVLVRRMGEPQRDIGTILTELRAQVEELADARVFDYAHDRLDELIERSAVELESSEPDASVRTMRSIIRMIEGLIESLEESQGEQDEEEMQQQGGGGQGGQQGGEQPLIPPAQELKLLRDLQVQLADETRDTSVDPGADRDRVAEIGTTQRELLELGRDLAQRVQQQQSGPGGMPTMPEDARPDNDEAGVGDSPEPDPETGRGESPSNENDTPGEDGTP